MSDQDLKEKEDSAVLDDLAADFSPAERAEYDKLAENDPQEDDQLQLYSGEEKPKGIRGKITKKRGIVGGAIGLMIGGSIGVFSILQGPLQLIHFAQLLQQFHFSNNEDFMEGRTARLMYNIRNVSVGSAVAQSRLGTINNKIANNIELRLQREAGLRSIYHPQTGRLVGYEVVDLDRAVNFLGDNLEASADFDLRPPGELGADFGRTIDGQRPSGGVITFKDEKFKVRREFTRKITKAVSTSKVGGSIGSRLLIQRAGIDFHPIKNIKRSASDSLFDYYAKVKRERAERRQEGARPSVGIPDADSGDDDGDGTVDRGVDPELENAEREAREALADIGGTDVTNGEAKTALRNRIASRLGSAAAAVGILCTVRGLGSQAEELQQAQVILPMMRMGGEVVTSGNQLMSLNGLNIDEVGSLVSDLYDEETQSSWAAARSIQAEQGQELNGPDIPPYAKPGKVGEKPLFFRLIDDIPGLSSACSVQDTIGGLPIIKQIGEITGAVIGTVLPVDELVDGIVGWLAGDAVNTLAQGAELGNIANYGARLAANDQAIATGGRELTGTEVAQLDALSHEKLKQERANKSFYAKVFDPYDANSVIASAMRKTPQSPDAFVASAFNAPFSFIPNLFKGKASAQVAYDYGFSEFGFSLAEQDDARFEDPLENAAIVENQLQELNAEYGECFAMTIDVSGNIVSGQAKRYDEIDSKCKDSANEELLRYRFYIADTITAHSLACYEGEDDSCRQLGFGNQTTSSTSPITNGAAKGVDTSSQSCRIGTDAGIGETPVDSVKIRLCNVSGITVNVAIEQNVDAAIKGASSEGITLGGSSYRSYQRQIELRREHCGTSEYDVYQKSPSSCSPPTARPGESLHEWGLAVDFNCNGGSVSRSGPCFRWLESNQSVHGLINLPSEPWHWSTTGG